MEILIISGLSGAGKSRAADILEDLNYYCVDNMPITLMPKFVEFCIATRGRYEKVALVTDVRGRESFSELFKALEEIKQLGCDSKILYMDADLPTVVKRYKETRRKHPLSPDGKNLEEAVKRENQMLSSIKENADYVINTSRLTLGQLQHRIYELFGFGNQKNNFNVNVMSFGFKHGIPIEADLVFDVRFLPNPFYVSELRNLNGLDKDVRDYVMESEQTKVFMSKLTDMVDYLIPNYMEEGKYSVVICIGCTGGHHRSVAIAQALSDHLAAEGYKTDAIHRDIGR